MVQLFVAVTDQSWFDRLSASSPHDEVNFWAPSGRNEFRALAPGELFLFKLHAPNNFTAGGASSVMRRTCHCHWHGTLSAPRTAWRPWTRCARAFPATGPIGRLSTNG